MTRVQIPVHTDRWMMGDRYGTIVKITRSRVMQDDWGNPREIAHVKLDKSGKTLRFVLDDCKEI